MSVNNIFAVWQTCLLREVQGCVFHGKRRPNFIETLFYLSERLINSLLIKYIVNEHEETNSFERDQAHGVSAPW